MENQQLTVAPCFLIKILLIEEMSLAMFSHQTIQTETFLRFQSRVIAAAKKVLGFESKTGMPTNINLPFRMDLLKKSEKLNCLHELAGKVVDAFVFDQSSYVDAIVNTVVTEQEKENLPCQQKLTPDGRFPCRCPGCNSTFKPKPRARVPGDVRKFSLSAVSVPLP